MIMGDGYFENQDKTIYLCTDSFSYSDILRLITLMDEKLGLKSGTKKRISSSGKVHYRIRFSRLSVLKIQQLVKLHMHPLMFYKIGLK